ncbi:unnamed protein product [Blepharisma stoltei]|uniref:Uncharacterized protein n=1 Tax=Blepharisma stoltei TaxID=1481888 RepID=A0AAU9IK65_9CILI|nr:unnamed protein product [Blepharisma stoltei]
MSPKAVVANGCTRCTIPGTFTNFLKQFRENVGSYASAPQSTWTRSILKPSRKWVSSAVLKAYLAPSLAAVKGLSGTPRGFVAPSPIHRETFVYGELGIRVEFPGNIGLLANAKEPWEMLPILTFWEFWIFITVKFPGK